jgi:hypothetical protein
MSPCGVRAHLVYLLALLPSLTGHLAWSQANVDESQETAVVYVDAVKGSDSNPGTKSQPLQTINAAASLAITNNYAGIGTRVIINPGMYRESIAMTVSGHDTTFPMTFQAVTAGTVILSGADIWTGWKATKGNPQVYLNSWPYKWGLCPLDTGSDQAPPEEDIVRRREMVLVNGVLLTQVLVPSAFKKPGLFYLDEDGGKIYIWPPNGTDMSTAVVEIPTRESLFVINGKSNIVLRGLTFQHANSCRGTAAVTVEFSASNVLLDKDYFYWNNSAGLKMLFTTNTTVQNSVSNHNGTDGMKGYQTKYDLWQNNQTRYNGWRGAQGVYYAWGTAGTHFGLAHNQTVKNIDSSFNQTFGFHWDTDNENSMADSLLASQNQLAGGFFEKSQGPLTLSNSTLCSGNPYAGPNSVGLELRNSSHVTLTGNTFLGSQTQLLMIGVQGGIVIQNWETGQSYTLFNQYDTFTNNILAGSGNQLLVSGGQMASDDWSKFQSTLVSDYNTWWNADESKVYFMPVPNPWTKTDFAGWQSDTGEDRHSVWKAPTNPGARCHQTPESDFWFIISAFDGFQTVTRGGSVSFATNIVPLNFTGTVTLSSDGVQYMPGGSGRWDTKTITGGEGAATFTVTTSASTPPGDYLLTLIANNGSTTRAMSVTVIVQ